MSLKIWVQETCSRSSDRIQFFKAAFSYTLLSYNETQSQSLSPHVILIQGPHYIYMHHFSFSTWAARTDQLHQWERRKVVNTCFGILLGITLQLHTAFWHQCISVQWEQPEKKIKKKKTPTTNICSS